MSDQWIKVEAGSYRHAVYTTVTIRKTYSRSGWRVHDSRTGFHGYAETLARAKDMAGFNGLLKFPEPLKDSMHPEGF